MDAKYPIRLAARLSGLSPHVIRIWEQRYQAVAPERSSTNRRYYSRGDVERLNLLRELTLAGHSIGQVARLPVDKLREMSDASSGADSRRNRITNPGSPAGSRLDECLTAIQSVDERRLLRLLQRGAASLGVQGVLRQLVGPLAETVGDMWREGIITAAHEHFASEVIRAFLNNLARPFGGNEGGASLVVATPSGQLHELGALIVCAVATNLGWRVTYLGASLPAIEISGVAMQKQARAVALSLVYPEDDSGLPGELETLREALPPDVAMLVGGRAAPAYRDVLNRIGATLISDLAQLGVVLDSLRKPPKRSCGQSGSGLQ